MNIKKLWMIFFISSCKSTQLGVKELCTYSYQFDTCICRQYDLKNLKSVSESFEYEVEYCDDVTGFKAQQWASDLIPKLKYAKRKYRDLERRCR